MKSISLQLTKYFLENKIMLKKNNISGLIYLSTKQEADNHFYDKIKIIIHLIMTSVFITFIIT